MSYNLKYYLQYKNSSNISYQLNIYQDGTFTPLQIRGTSEPVEIGIKKDKKSNIYTSYLDINLLATDDRQFEDLFTPDYFKYFVNLTKSGITIFNGYLDTELYSAPFNKSTNYIINFSANDGLVILKRKYFSSTTGLKSLWELLQICLNSINIQRSIYVGLATTSPDFFPTIESQETLMHKLYARSDNFYSAKGEPANLWDVLENILKILSAYIIIINDNIYIFDYNFLAASGSWKKYNYAYIYQSTISKGSAIDINSYIIDAGDHTLIPAKSTAAIRIITNFDSRLFENKIGADDMIGSSIYTDSTYASGDYGWKEDYYSDSRYFAIGYGSFRKYYGVGAKNNTIVSYKYTLPEYFSGVEYSSAFTLKSAFSKYFVNDNIFSKYGLKLSITARCRTKLYPDSNDPSAKKVKWFYFFSLLRIGGKQFTNSADIQQWVDSDFPALENVIKCEYVADINNSNDFAEDKDMKFSLNIPLNVFSGSLTFAILNRWDAVKSDGLDASSYVKEISIHDISLELIELATGKQIENKDILIKADMDAYWSEQGEISEFSMACDEELNPINKSALFYLNNSVYYFANNFYYNGILTTLQRHYLNHVISNSYAPMNQMSLILKGLSLNEMNYFNFSKFAGKKFIIDSLKLNTAKDVIDITIREISSNIMTTYDF